MHPIFLFKRHQCGVCKEKKFGWSFRDDGGMPNWCCSACEIALKTAEAEGQSVQAVVEARRPPPEAPPRDDDGTVRLMKCDACKHNLPASAFHTFLNRNRESFEWIFRDDLLRPTKKPQKASEWMLFTGRHKPQRCDACIGWTPCVRCGQIFEHRAEERDRAYWEIALRSPQQPQCLVCKKCNAYLMLTEDDLALIGRLSRPASSTIAQASSSAELTFGSTPAGTPVTINETDRTRHIYLIGGTGSGKSVTLTNLAAQDITAARGFTAIDPHGDLAQGLLARVPPEHFARVMYFDPTDEDAPPFNLLATDFDPNKLTADLVATFKMFFGDSWGFQMEALLSNAILTLLLDRIHEPHTFADLRQLLIDEEYRRTIVDRCPDEVARSFWEFEYKSMQKDAARPILTRLSTVLMAGSPLRRVLTNKANGVDVADVMNTGKILLVNLSKGALGEGPARLLGGLFVTAITQAALARQRIPEKDRTPHTLYCDEFQNFADLPSTESILSEARKYQLRLVLAHQTMAQVDARLMQNILGNVRTLVAFRVSPDDASKLARAMGRTRHVYPDTGEVYDLAKERRTRAQNIEKHLHQFKDLTVGIPSRQGDDGPPIWEYSRRGFGSTDPQSAMHWLRSVADQDPTTYDPGRPGGFKWKEVTWPIAQDFQNLATCHAFAMRNIAASTCELRVPFPPPVPYPDNIDRWHQRRARETAAAAHLEQNRLPPKPQELRSPAVPTHTLDKKPQETAVPPPADDLDEFLS